ncbi:hypothetical protein FHETE_7246 [Fusarium heterosporum]|uniref:Uncharacterized protein n=1 Tax=Fusarium heterosporum TaxID=42747 RepID=A0A8H5WLB3_FUSHE|nr:hypothetical protein FHETE_7246 [Fusarium heterosporum]
MLNASVVALLSFSTNNGQCHQEESKTCSSEKSIRPSATLNMTFGAVIASGTGNRNALVSRDRCSPDTISVGPIDLSSVTPA